MRRARTGFSLVEVLVAAATMVVLALVFHATYSFSLRGEGRDTRRTEALILASELLDQVDRVHARFRDLPLKGGCDVTQVGVEGLTLFGNPGGQIYLSKPLPGFTRNLTIEVLREGQDSPLLRPDRAYLVRATVRYPGPGGEARELSLSTVRSRPVVQKPALEFPPWAGGP